MSKTLIRTLPLCLAVCVHGAEPSAPADSTPLTRAQVQSAIDRGLDYLLGIQNPDGSWGGAHNAVFTFGGGIWSNPESHRAWRIATTGLCVMAILDTGDSDKARAAADHGIDYILQNAEVKRPDSWDLMNNWAYIYGLDALAKVYADPRYTDSPRRAEIPRVAQRFIDQLATFQAADGGWGYLELDTPKPIRPTGGTSFTTATAVIALQNAKRQGFAGDPAVVERAVRGVARCKMPSGAYTYSIRAVPDPRRADWIDQIKGSLSRIPVCQVALLMSGQDIPADEIRTGLDHFFRHHRFLDIALNRPIPHEAYYYNSGYFYLFGHYYVALVIEQLPAEERSKYWPLLQREVIKIQQKDGSMWDYGMHSYHKPYGVAFGLMTLAHSLQSTP